MTPYHYYSAFGLSLASALPCPELAAGSPYPDVVIRYGEVPLALPTARASGVRYQAAPGLLLLTVDGVARFLVRQGQEIVIDPAPASDEDSIRLFLLGPAIGALLQQRGILTLHGSAIEVDGGCIGFLGRSGVGKSTLAAALCRRGYRFVTDDVCAVSLAHAAIPRVHPGYPQMKLWADMLRTFGESTAPLRRVRPQLDKHAWPVPEAFHPAPLPLRRLYVLHTTTTDSLTFHALGGPEKLMVLKNHTYREPFLDGLDGRVPHFTICAAIATQIPMHRIVRPQYPFRLEEMVAGLEQEWAA